MKLKDNKSISKREIKQVLINNKPHKGPKDVLNSFDNVIELENVEKTYTNKYIINKVLKGISLSISEGQFVVFLGRSGSGKTNLMNIMSGLIRASNGKTVVLNRNLINLTNKELIEFRRKNIGYIYQEYGLLQTLTVYENILTGYNLNKTGMDKKEIDEIIDYMGLTPYKNKFPIELSGGQQQRVAIARAIAKSPKIIFGDEPTGAVDSKMSKNILSILKKINRERKTTIIIITHDKEIGKIADIVYEISDGKIINKTINKMPLEVEDLA